MARRRLKDDRKMLASRRFGMEGLGWEEGRVEGFEIENRNESDDVVDWERKGSEAVEMLDSCRWRTEDELEAKMMLKER